jgi:hypothetical protein
MRAEARVLRFARALVLSLAAAGGMELVAGATTVTDLRLACRAFQEHPQSAAGLRCRAYLLGFIEGTSAAGDLVVGHQGRDREAGWEEEAARTRIGMRLRRERLLRTPEICLPDPVPLDALARRIAGETAEPSGADPRRAADVLRAVLERYYGCARG